jgi:hypothetical protein
VRVTEFNDSTTYAEFDVTGNTVNDPAHEVVAIPISYNTGTAINLSGNTHVYLPHHIGHANLRMTPIRWSGADDRQREESRASSSSSSGPSLVSGPAVTSRQDWMMPRFPRPAGISDTDSPSPDAAPSVPTACCSSPP